VVAPGNDAIPALLRKFRNRLLVRRLLIATGTLLPVLLASSAIAALLLHFAGQPLPTLDRVVVMELLILLLGVSLYLARNWPTLEQSARIFDRLAQTRDRSHTALQFARHPDRDAPMHQLALAECQKFLEQHTPPLLPPIRRNLAWLWLPPFLSLVLIYAWSDASRQAATSSEPNPVELPSDSLSSLTDEIAKAGQQQDQERLEQLAEALQAEMQKLSQTELDEEAQKALLRETASLEELLRQLQEAAKPKAINPEELRALANALERQNPELAEDLQSGDLQRAAGQLEKLMNQLANQPDPQQALSQLAQSLSEELDRLNEEEKQELAEQMQQAAELAASEEMQQLREKMQEISQLLQQQGRSGNQGNQTQSQGGSAPSRSQAPMTRESLQQMLDALDQLKEQLQNQNNEQQGQGGSSPQPQRGLGQGQVPMSLPMPGMGEAGNQPGPGSELDQGTTKEETGETASQVDPEGPAKLATGTQNTGEASVEMIESAGDNSRAAAEYKAVYEALESERSEAIQREEIPIGSRLYLKRYFESIRPNY